MPPSLTLLLRRRRRILPSHHCRQQTRTFVDARVKWVRDRALDHAVEKEKHLQPFHALKDLLLLSGAPSSSSFSSSSSSPSLPLSSIAARRSDLGLPFRAIRFVRLFPSAFLEDHPSSSRHPVIRPTPALLSLHDAELRAVSASAPDAASRLLRLLMLSPSRRLPLPLLHRLRWDLALPRDFPRSLLPDYPDFFRLAPAPSPNSPALDLELVCYSRDLAVSAIERYAARTGGHTKGAPLPFPLHFSRGFDLEKKVRNWLDEWQKLPYISPYENASHLPPKSDLAEKWTVGVLHEVLSLLICKKTEKENLVLLGEHLGLPPGFRKVIAHHPGIFYVSNKLRTQTVVLREAYRRDLLVEKHPVMGLRYQYIHLMHMGKEAAGKKKDRKSRRVAAPEAEADAGVGGEDEEDEDDDDDVDDYDEEEEEELSPASRVDSEDEESDDEDGNGLSYSNRM